MDFIIVDYEGDKDVPIILGNGLLHIDDTIIKVWYVRISTIDNGI